MVEQQEATPNTVLTPTARLARVEKRRFAEARVAEGRRAWRAPDVLSLSAWLGRLRQQTLISGALDRVPVSAAQARALWRQVIDADVFIGEPRVHALAERAWRTLHEHRLAHPRAWPEPLLSEDSGRFRDWVARFERLCAERGVIDEWTFAAYLPALIRESRVELPSGIELKGFDLPLAPIYREIMTALAEVGVEVRGMPDPPAEGQPADTTIAPGLELQCFVEPDDELRAAAEWARVRLGAGTEHAPDRTTDQAPAGTTLGTTVETTAGTIAIVVRDLPDRLSRVERIFAQVFDPPGYALQQRGRAPWHVSLGLPLAEWPLAADALSLLKLEPACIDQPAAGRLLASPYLSGWPAEASRRAETSASLMRHAPYEITAHELTEACNKAGAGILGNKLAVWRRIRAEHRQPVLPSQWVGPFQAELDALGFGHGRPLDSREFQILQRWHDLLEEFAALDVVLDQPLARGRALSMLVESAAGVTFRERDPGCPVEILGVEEALGARFDALWITSLDAATWPGAAYREPLIPGPIQAGVPAATGDGKLARTRQELAGLLRCAASLSASFSTGSESPPREATALLPQPRIIKPDHAAQSDPPVLETIPDDCHGPILAEAGTGTKAARGGTGVLRDQSACPFRAFAHRRLGARELPCPRPGLDTSARGSLIHKALEALWRGLDGRAALLALKPEDLERRIAQAAEYALDQLIQRHRLVLGRAGKSLELRCTVRVLARWLELECERDDFHVGALEQEISMKFAGLRLTGKIDRIDETAAGTILIDYKTGRAGRNGWRPEERMADPQLPAYALAGPSVPAALAFARVRPDELRFDGLCRADVGIPGVTELATAGGAWKESEDWDELLQAWRQHLDALALSFQQGRAEVDPRDGQVCRTCHLHALCRIQERQSTAIDEEPA